MSGRYPRVPEVTGGPTPPVANTGACLYVVFTAFVLQLVGLAKREPSVSLGALGNYNRNCNYLSNAIF